MKGIINCFFLFSYLLVSTQSIELLKIPMLYAHYQEHKAENTTLSFFQFVALHYGGSDHSDSHNSLPFKAVKASNFICNILIEKHFESKANSFLEIYFPEIKSFYKSNYSFRYLQSIWQPPKCL